MGNKWKCGVREKRGGGSKKKMNYRGRKEKTVKL